MRKIPDLSPVLFCAAADPIFGPTRTLFSANSTYISLEYLTQHASLRSPCDALFSFRCLIQYSTPSDQLTHQGLKPRLLHWTGSCYNSINSQTQHNTMLLCQLAPDLVQLPTTQQPYKPNSTNYTSSALRDVPETPATLNNNENTMLETVF
ncbi:hypothetical protein F511_32245 [Dorcoceras hygrometricum]|uniref:Uncharacterized protein n=1 Tax=Dorcoceras hygrometricum TaxID=472368 RepID=A0A2Z7A2K6_9LAMI|nr:hypothetical protein F511_32245 [Dorcoceras hygrometricum]